MWWRNLYDLITFFSFVCVSSNHHSNWSANPDNNNCVMKCGALWKVCGAFCGASVHCPTTPPGPDPTVWTSQVKINDTWTLFILESNKCYQVGDVNDDWKSRYQPHLPWRYTPERRRREKAPPNLILCRFGGVRIVAWGWYRCEGSHMKVVQVWGSLNIKETQVWKGTNIQPPSCPKTKRHKTPEGNCTPVETI